MGRLVGFTVDYPLDEYDTWWKPLIAGIVYERGHKLPNGMHCAMDRRGPVITVELADSVTDVEEEGRVMEAKCVEILDMHERAQAALALKNLRDVDATLREAACVASELAEVGKRVKEAGKSITETVETAEKLGSLVMRLLPFVVALRGVAGIP